MSTKEAPLIYSAINKVMKSVGAVSKNRTNPQQGYNFRGIDDMYNALHDHLCEHGVFVTPKVIDAIREERTTKNGGLLMYVILTVEFTFYATDGSYVLTTMIGEAMDTADKASNKAMSAAFKYALMQVFAIPTADDKDTENSTPEPVYDGNTVSTKMPSTQELSWLNATNKEGEINELGAQVAQALAEGKRTWQSIELKYKVSKKDRAAVNELAATIMESMETN